MKIHDIHHYILTHFPQIPPENIHYTKNTKQGDFVIHTFTHPNLQLPTIPHVTINQQPKMLYLTVNKAAFAPSIIKSILLTPNYGHKVFSDLFYVIEYSSPNIAKKFHPGHLRTTILGNYIKNICEAMGINTYSINYLGDWGKQFGLVGVGFEKFGSEEEMEKDALKHLYNVYVKTSGMDLDEEARTWFRDLERGNENNVLLWKRFRDLSIEKYKELYAILNCKFDEYSGESLYGEMGREIILKLENNEEIINAKVIEQNDLKREIKNLDDNESKEVKKLIEFFEGYEANKDNEKKINMSNENTKDNSVADILNKSDKNKDDKNSNSNIANISTVVDEERLYLEKESIVKKDDGEESRYIETSCGKVCVMKRDGSTLYVTRDIAAVVDRITRLNPDKIIYVVASQQDLYLKQLFEITHMAGIGFKNGENILHHINYGMIEGMSTRKGNVEFLEDIIDEARNVMLEKMKNNKEKYEKIENIEKTAEILAVTALIIHDFDAKRIKGYKFNIEQCTEINGFTGPYLQYVHCRLKSIEDKNNNLIDLEKLTEDEIKSIYTGEIDEKISEIIFTLAKYPLVLEKSFAGFEPSFLVSYLMDLCKSINGIVSNYKVLNTERSVALKRLLFYRGARIVLGNGLKILGIIPLNRM